MIENQDTKILWDFNIRTSRIIEARRPDIELIDRMNQEMFIIDVATPRESVDKKAEKISKYQELSLKISWMWWLVLSEYITLVGVITRKDDSMQQTAVLGSAGLDLFDPQTIF